MGCCLTGTDYSAYFLSQCGLRIKLWVGMDYKYDHRTDQPDRLPALFISIWIGTAHRQRISKNILCASKLKP